MSPVHLNRFRGFPPSQNEIQIAQLYTRPSYFSNSTEAPQPDNPIPIYTPCFSHSSPPLFQNSLSFSHTQQCLHLLFSWLRQLPPLPLICPFPYVQMRSGSGVLPSVEPPRLPLYPLTFPPPPKQTTLLITSMLLPELVNSDK